MLRSLQTLNERSVLYLLIAIALSSLVLSAFSHYLNGEIAWWGWADGAFQNFSTEMMGAIITFGLFDLVWARNKEEKNRAENQNDEIKRLSNLLRNKNRSTAIGALAELKIYTNKFEQLDLSHQNLRYADFSRTAITGVNFSGTDLSNSDFSEASMRVLIEFHGKISTDVFVSFDNANLEHSNFTKSTLFRVRFRGTNLRNMNLRHAKLEGVIFDENTILPDGQNWSRNVDLTCFTDPDHPDFWQPE